MEGYPPSPVHAGIIVLGLLAWSVVAGVVWGMTGAFYIDPTGGDIAASPGTVIGVVVGFVLIVRDLPDVGDVEPDALPTPDLGVSTELE